MPLYYTRAVFREFSQQRRDQCDRQSSKFTYYVAGTGLGGVILPLNVSQNLTSLLDVSQQSADAALKMIFYTFLL